ncbi:uncharacterized protein MONOS_5206 [Monocercomonoides exilis]|uniref:uncharacterized protein n=1 Tax=Monocercomonoides exilis TaxID=2049356 RepID=UPI00355ABBC6|nr:hypothetical protein MONOS_5206 [Monocercomonoides exilis]|eukprot:MONOS_5206.1-p1 / transcript=MONOS_5206.1 / gene=MONOS_5206 / organism=Monocercomonoides_exilis_PA203 / gene_product=unspecified product / transcript_product=unspecified product / location=Mono_scaffold00149:29640-30563(-) / protein_length=116 / sequence_SO=supercontig / SO=protein_coding / is_pseudo=false
MIYTFSSKISSYAPINTILLTNLQSIASPQLFVFRTDSVGTRIPPLTFSLLVGPASRVAICPFVLVNSADSGLPAPDTIIVIVLESANITNIFHTHKKIGSVFVCMRRGDAQSTA